MYIQIFDIIHIVIMEIQGFEPRSSVRYTGALPLSYIPLIKKT